MQESDPVSVFCALLGLTVTFFLSLEVLKFWATHRSKLKTHFLHIKQLFTQEDLTELILFPDASDDKPRYPCITFFRTLSAGRNWTCNNYPRCPFVHINQDWTSLMKIAWLLNRATHSIDLCMYKFTIEELAELLIRKDRSGTKVRIITDNGREHNENNQLPRLRNNKVEVREARFVEDEEEKYRPLMHNKFFIIDQKTCFLGSMNWTKKAVKYNHETVIKTSDATVVDPLMIKFEELWAKLEQ